jgi:hypothetical protein
MSAFAPDCLCQIEPVSQPSLPKLLGPLLHRGDGRVQVGVEPGRSVVLDGPPPAQLDALRELDGTRTLPAALATPEGQALLALLVRVGLVVDGTTTVGAGGAAAALGREDTRSLLRVTTPPPQGYAGAAARADACVLVVGRGAVPDGVASVLRRAGVGDVRSGAQAAADWEHDAVDGHAIDNDGNHHDLDHDDIDADEATALLAPGPADSPMGDQPDLVVLCGRHVVDPRQGRGWRRHGIPLLPVVIGATETVVGPLVAGANRPCLDCLDHTRTDLDPAWPTLLAQLTGPAVGAGEEVGGEESLVALAAAMAAMVALGWLDGQPQPVGRSLEAGLPWPGVRQRDWPVHPRCRCGSRDTAGRPTDASGDGQVRMAG